MESGNDDPAVLASRPRRLREAGADGLRHYLAGLAALSRRDALMQAIG